MEFGTRLLHNGNEIDPHTGAASIPMYLASTYHQFDPARPSRFDYARSGNPTRLALERTIAELEGGIRGFAFSSGMAAISTVFLLFSTGDHLVVSRDVYGGTYRVLTQVLSRLGISCTFVDTTDLKQVEAAIRPETRGLFVETPSNPTLKVTDLAGAAAIARSRGLILIVDNTFLTPYYQTPLQLGADIVVHSATKFLGGHSDVVAGLVVVKGEELAERIGALQNTVGAVLGVQDAWLLQRGMKTLKARMDVSARSAARIAEWLMDHPAVRRVYYTGLPGHPGYRLQAKQARGHGAVLSFDVGSRERAMQVLKRVTLPLVAVSLGAVESILSHPATMSHASMPKQERERRGITDGLLRLSVGLENVEDLIADLAEALTEKKVFALGGG